MVDVISSKARSRLMAAVHAKGNRSTEVALALLFRKLRIRGWRRHLKLPGTPDFVFLRERVVVFADGCFWHGCPRHYTRPATHVSYWRGKVRDNRSRDRRQSRRLRRIGWSVFRVLECQIRRGKLPARLLQRLIP